MYGNFLHGDVVAEKSCQTRAELGRTSGMGIETIKSECNPKNLRVGRNKIQRIFLIFTVFCISGVNMFVNFNVIF
jgi:hypothetical protein